MSEMLIYVRDFIFYMGPLACVMFVTFCVALYYLTRR